MKKTFYAIATVALFAAGSCTKNAEGNSGVISAEQSSESAETIADKPVSEHTDRYVADDGSSALVTFKNTGGEKSISISRDKITISAPEKADGVYEDHDYSIVAKNDTITITQGNNVITLKKARTNTP